MASNLESLPSSRATIQSGLCLARLLITSRPFRPSFMKSLRERLCCTEQAKMIIWLRNFIKSVMDSKIPLLFWSISMIKLSEVLHLCPGSQMEIGMTMRVRPRLFSVWPKDKGFLWTESQEQYFATRRMGHHLGIQTWRLQTKHSTIRTVVWTFLNFTTTGTTLRVLRALRSFVGQRQVILE